LWRSYRHRAPIPKIRAETVKSFFSKSSLSWNLQHILSRLRPQVYLWEFKLGSRCFFLLILSSGSILNVDFDRTDILHGVSIIVFSLHAMSHRVILSTRT
jgi:hypothetical protein